LEEVVVTAQKREQNVQDVGISIATFTGDQIRQLGFTNSQDIVAQIPGVLFAAAAGSDVIGLPTIRGVSQNDFTPAQETPTAMYVDEAYLSFIGANAQQIFDVERIEVLRGPQGSLFGRNATGGLIHIITRKPTQAFEAFADLTLASYQQIKFEGAVSGPLTERLAGRLAIATNKHDGYLENRIGPDGLNRDAKNWRGQLLFNASDDLEVQVSVFGGRNDHQTIAGAQHRSAGVNADGLGFDLPPDLDFWGTCPGCDLLGYNDTDGNAHAGAYDATTFFDRESWGVTGKITWSLEQVTLTSITHYLDFDLNYQEDSDASPNSLLMYNFDQQAHQLSQELRLSGAAGQLRWVTGFYYLDIDSDNRIGITAPLFDADQNDPYSLKTESWAVFGQLEYDFAPHWTVIGGFRWTEEQKHYEFNSACSSLLGDPTLAGCSLLFPQVPGTVQGIGGFIGAQDNGDYSAKLQLNWRPNDDWLLYAGVTRGNKAGGFNATLSGLLTPAEVPFDPEVLTSYEGGFKAALFNGTTSLNASVFYYDYEDYQAFNVLALDFVVSNANSEIAGFEAELVTQPAEGWDFRLGLSLLDAKVFDVRLPSGRVTDTVPPQAPRYTINGLARKEWPAWGGGKLAVQFDFSYVDDYQASTVNAPATAIPEYTISNGRLSYTSANGRWEAALFVDNIADTDVLYYKFDVGVLGFNQEVYLPPRWVGGQFIYRWK
jgi:iron complex outermembrane receptor protein